MLSIAHLALMGASHLSMDITITPYTPDDRDGAKGVVLAGFKDFGFVYQRKYDFDLDDPQKYYIDQGGMFYVLKDSGKVIGTVAIINKGNHIAELKRLYVKKEYQGKGLGSKLFDTAVLFCKNNGFTNIEFETNKKFTKAHSLYQRRGFRIVKRNESSYYMEKDL